MASKTTNGSESVDPREVSMLTPVGGTLGRSPESRQLARAGWSQLFKPNRLAAAAVFALLLVAAALPAPAASHTPSPIPATAVTAVEAVGLTVSDMDRSIAFFTNVLTFEKVAEFEVSGPDVERLLGVFGTRARIVRLRLGTELLELTQFLAPEGRPLPADSRSNDRWFQHVAIVVSDMDAAYRHLREAGVRHASTGPQRLPDWNPNAGGIEAFYFKDPDGHALEVIHFPAGKGDPRWQTTGGRLFLGIDHTAIVVADTETSLGYYRDALGLRVAGASENWGIEQEHLNNVFGARLRITALRAPAGPGIELLEYLAPRDGRPYPEGSHANDLWHWQTRLAASDAEGLAGRLRSEGLGWISPGAVAMSEPGFGFSRGALVRDPDGHALLIADPGTPPH